MMNLPTLRRTCNPTRESRPGTRWQLRRTGIALAIGSLIATAPAMAAAAPQQTSQEKSRGAVSGLVIGAATAGPIGAFAGTVLGGEVFGRLFEQRRVNRELTLEVASLSGALTTERQQHQQLIALLNDDLDKVLRVQSVQPAKRSLPVQFRTASSELEPQYMAELEQIARVLERNRDASVNLSGFSDRRGDDAFNQQLSEARVARIERFLLERGARREQVLGMAFGESRPIDSSESLEGNFFDRRVVVELNLNLDPQLATR